MTSVHVANIALDIVHLQIKVRPLYNRLLHVHKLGVNIGGAGSWGSWVAVKTGYRSLPLCFRVSPLGNY